MTKDVSSPRGSGQQQDRDKPADVELSQHFLSFQFSRKTHAILTSSWHKDDDGHGRETKKDWTIYGQGENERGRTDSM